MNISKVLELIDQRLLEELGKKYAVDKANTKITGSFILMSFVRNVLLNRSISLRTIEEINNSTDEFKKFLKSKNHNKKDIDHSSLGKRIKTINVSFFKDIYENLVETYNKNINQQEKFHRFDSTIINLSSKLLKNGLIVGGFSKKITKRNIKITIGLKNSIPSNVRICDNQSDCSEDVALLKAINNSKIEKNSILLFDRGIGRTATYEDFTKRKINFVTRINTNRNYKILKNNIITKENNAAIEIVSDQIIYLYGVKEKIVKCKLRLIRAINKHGTELRFLTNLTDLSSYEITEAYKRRWDIEVFFKFLKSNLQFKNFISYELNGMHVYLYCVLIAAILFLIFKVKNKLVGFKIALLRFTLLLEKEIVKTAVILSGGDINLMKIYNQNLDFRQ